MRRPIVIFLSAIAGVATTYAGAQVGVPDPTGPAPCTPLVTPLTRHPVLSPGLGFTYGGAANPVTMVWGLQAGLQCANDVLPVIQFSCKFCTMWDLYVEFVDGTADPDYPGDNGLPIRKGPTDHVVDCIGMQAATFSGTKTIVNVLPALNASNAPAYTEIRLRIRNGDCDVPAWTPDAVRIFARDSIHEGDWAGLPGVL